MLQETRLPAPCVAVTSMELGARFTGKRFLTCDLTSFDILPNVEDNRLLSRPMGRNPFYLEGSSL